MLGSDLLCVWVLARHVPVAFDASCSLQPEISARVVYIVSSCFKTIDF